MPYHLASSPHGLFLGICHVRGAGKRRASASNDYWDLKSFGGFYCVGSTHTKRSAGDFRGFRGVVNCRPNQGLAEALLEGQQCFLF